MVPELLEVSELEETNLRDRKSTRLNSSHTVISYAVFCLKKKKKIILADMSMSACKRKSSIFSLASGVILLLSCVRSLCSPHVRVRTRSLQRSGVPYGCFC